MSSRKVSQPGPQLRGTPISYNREWWQILFLHTQHTHLKPENPAL